MVQAARQAVGCVWSPDANKPSCSRLDQPAVASYLHWAGLAGGGDFIRQRAGLRLRVRARGPSFRNRHKREAPLVRRAITTCARRTAEQATSAS